MEKGWIKIYTTTAPNKAEIIKGMLEENGIHSVIINKQDSSYLIFGEAELYVNREDSVKAINLINQENL